MTSRNLYRVIVGFALVLAAAGGIDTGRWWLLLCLVLYGVAVWRSEFPLPDKETTDE